MDQLSAFRASTDSKSLLGFIDHNEQARAPLGSMAILDHNNETLRSRMISPS